MPIPRPFASHTLPDLTGEFIDDGALQLVSLIGAGAYGKVYKARDTTAAPDEVPFYAVKCMPRYEPDSREAAIQENELIVHSMLSDHPRVITFYRFFVTDKFVFVVLELSTGGDLFHAMIERQSYRGRPALIKRVFNEILDAVEFLHRNGIYHRDIKPENLLCSSAGTEIRLADFGLSTHAAISTQFGCGSKAYMSPESLDKNNPDGCYLARCSDMWAISVIFTNLIAGRHPWFSAVLTDRRFASFRSNSNYLLRELNITREANALLKRCFHENPRRRPTIDQFRASVNEIEMFAPDDVLLSPPRCITPPAIIPATTLEWAVVAPPSSPVLVPVAVAVAAAAPVDPCATPRPAHAARMPQPIKFSAFIVACSSSASSSYSFVTRPPASTPSSPTSASAAATPSDSSVPSSDLSVPSFGIASDSTTPTTPATSVSNASAARAQVACAAAASPYPSLPTPPPRAFIGSIRALPFPFRPTAPRAGAGRPLSHAAANKPLPPLPVPPAIPHLAVAPLAICKPGQFRSVASNARPTLPVRKQFLNKLRFLEGL